MAGIYLHIPFCRQACHYCNFHFSTSLNRKNDFVTALLKEMEEQRHYIGSAAVETVYFGGGTPSLLTEEELGQILTRLRDINRLSIGIQSFCEEDLQWMNRAHGAGQAADSIRMAQQEGFDNISIDLIYGGPTLPDGHWEKNVAQAVASGIPHLSCYALTVEPRTALDKMIHQKKKEAVSPDDQARQFLLLMDWLAVAGYEHYEISNFSLPGHRSRHNSSYWQGKPYLGLGPSAHSYNGSSRQWNVANNAQYTDALLSGKLLFEKEVLTPVQQLNEYIMISLRTMEGCDLRVVSERWGITEAQKLQKQAARYVREGMIKAGEGLVLTREGKLLADGIAAELFFGPEE
jgi:oxygen-independent coproporphyrinogen-3 oxidase